MRISWLVAVGAFLAGPVAAQAFNPPPVQREGPGGTHLGLLGFGVRVGADLSDGVAVMGIALDAGNLFTHRFRIRPSAEVGIGNGANTYVGSLEGLYRLSGENQAVTPYVGGGLAIAGHAGCGDDSGCPSVWVNLVAGIEVRYRSTFNWLFEYHAMDLFQRNRVYVGLTTRRGN